MKFKGTSYTQKNVLEILQQEGIFLPADCGGRGTCGKCKIRFISKAPEASEAELKMIKPDELEKGIRLACCSKISGDFEIEYELKEEDMQAESINIDSNEDLDEDGDVSCAIDIGTTTIAAALVQNKKVIKTKTTVNHQRAFGADVISRIQASNNGEKEKLKELVENDIKKLLEDMGMTAEKTKMVVSGNTTMEHLLQGLSCKTLGVVPFTPVDISLHEYKNYTILPGISTYVGADIVSGIVYTGMDKSEDVMLFLDLGTNGEMAIGNKEKILVASTAAGPAFEGVNISCGVAGIKGAISHIDINNGNVTYETIDNKQPVGICGSGVIEITRELLKEGIMDETGLLEDAYLDSGFPICENIIFTNKDIREVQLAKSAIRAGLETLLEEYGASYEDIKKMYLAGGFGQKINLEKTCDIGILPKELLEKTEAVGNSSLYGAVKFIIDEDARKRFLDVVKISEEVSLSDNKNFQEYYMDYMFF